VEPLPLLLREMLLFLLGKLRRLLQAVDVWITRRAFAHPYFCPPANDRRREEWKTFFRQLDAGHASGRTYLELHLERLVRTMMIVPPPGQTGRALELGCYMQMTPALALQLGYREVRGAYLGPAGKTENKIATIRGREVFRCDVDLFDAERDRFPYPDNHFDCVAYAGGDPARPHRWRRAGSHNAELRQPGKCHPRAPRLSEPANFCVLPAPNTRLSS